MIERIIGTVEYPIPLSAPGNRSIRPHSSRVPAVYMFIGIKPEEKEAIPGLHSPEYQFDDTVLAGAAAAFANIAIHGCMGELKEN